MQVEKQDLAAAMRNISSAYKGSQKSDSTESEPEIEITKHDQQQSNESSDVEIQEANANSDEEIQMLTPAFPSSRALNQFRTSPTVPQAPELVMESVRETIDINSQDSSSDDDPFDFKIGKGQKYCFQKLASKLDADGCFRRQGRPPKYVRDAKGEILGVVGKGAPVQKTGNSSKRMEYKPEWIVDFSHFPTEFQTVDDALLKYNNMGMPLNIQFKKLSIRKDEAGFTHAFVLSCYKRKAMLRNHAAPSHLKGNIGQGTKIKVQQSDQSHECPVSVKFKWQESVMSYVRQKSGAVFQHNHPLEIKGRQHLINDPLLMKELDLFVRCNLTCAAIHKIVRKKYKLKVRYEDVYNTIQAVRKELGVTNPYICKEKPMNQFQQFVLMLEDEQKRYLSQFNLKVNSEGTAKQQAHREQYPHKYKLSWAMQLDQEFANYFEKKVEESSRFKVPRLENIRNFIVVLPVFKQNFLKFFDLIFIDTSVVHKIPLSRNYSYKGAGTNKSSMHESDQGEIHLILVSGVDNNGRIVLFAWGFFKKLEVDNYNWFFKKFKSIMLEAGSQLDSQGVVRDKILHSADLQGRVVCTYDLNLQKALQSTLKNYSVRFCQTSVREKLSEVFPQEDSENLSNAYKLLLSQLKDLIYTDDPFKFQQLVDIILGQNDGVMKKSQLSFVKDLLKIKETWAQAYFRTSELGEGGEYANSGMVDLGITCLSRACSLREVIKQRLYSRLNTLELYKLIQEIGEKNPEQVRFNNRQMFNEEKLHGEKEGELNDSYHVNQMILHHPVMVGLRDQVSVFAFEQMLFQFSLSHNYICLASSEEKKSIFQGESIFFVGHYARNKKLRESRDSKQNLDGISKVTIVPMKFQPYSVDKRKYALGTEIPEIKMLNCSCTCEFSRSFQMICRHIFSIVSQFQLKEQCLIVNRRWENQDDSTKKYFQEESHRGSKMAAVHNLVSVKV